MSRQMSIDTFFKTKSNITPSRVKIMNDTKVAAKKRRSLSLVKPSTNPKSPKYAAPAQTPIKKEAEVIYLSSDDENAQGLSDKALDSSQNSIKTDLDSNSSQATIIYNLTPQTPAKTPRKTPNRTPSSTSDGFQSPASKKFYSPTKKRNVVKRTPPKRNLARDSFIQYPLYSNDTGFKIACEGMDDKTIFLLKIISKYLADQTLTRLLTETSQEMLGRCFQLTKPGMRLVCRLYWRQSGWYRREQLLQISTDRNNSLDDPTFQDMMNSLILNNFVTVSADTGINSLTFEEYAKILRADEIKQICKDLKLKIQSKQDAVEALRSFRKTKPISLFMTGGTPSNNAKRVIDLMKSKAGTCYKLSDTARNTFYALYVLMYLGANYSTIRDKQLELVLINDKNERETYPVDKSMDLDSPSVVFRSREEFNNYLQAHKTYEKYLAETDTREKCKMVENVFKTYKKINEEDMMRYKTLPEWLRKFTPAYIYVKILESGVQDLKREKAAAGYSLALDLLTILIDQIAFRQHKKAEWYAEKALILHKLLYRHDEAAKVLLEGLESDLPEEYKDVMRPRANKLATQKNISLDETLRARLTQCAADLILESSFSADHISKQPMENHKQRGKKTFEVHTDEDKQFLDCEEYCIIHYKTNEPFTDGHHWEGRIITTIFFLLFWDIIYTKPVGVVGVFLSHYQLYPLDMFTESFYTNRKTIIEERLRRIESMAVDTLVQTMQAKWDERPETELSGIQRSIGWECVRGVAGCLGGARLAALCRRLAAHYGRARSGFPDLTLWNTATKKIKFVEVKTDSDKPSLRQLQWMRYLEAHGVDTGFCYVGAHTSRCKARSEQTSSVEETAIVKMEPVFVAMKDTIKFECSPP